MAQQRDSIRDLCPPWLQRGVYEKYMYNFGLAEDVLLEKMYQATVAHMPGEGTVTANPYIGLDRVMPQGPFEADADYSVRLQRAFDAWQRAGSRRAVMSQALTYVADYEIETGTLRPRASCVSVSNGGTWATWDTYYNTSDITEAPDHARVTPENWDFDGNLTKWWRVWLVVFLATDSPVQKAATFGSGKKFGDSTMCFGFNLSSRFFDGYRALVRLWKSANAYYPWLIFSFDTGDSIYSPNVASGAGNPDPTWKRWSKNVGGCMVASRPVDSRFVDGTGIYATNCTIPLWT